MLLLFFIWNWYFTWFCNDIKYLWYLPCSNCIEFIEWFDYELSISLICIFVLVLKKEKYDMLHIHLKYFYQVNYQIWYNLCIIRKRFFIPRFNFICHENILLVTYFRCVQILSIVLSTVLSCVFLTQWYIILVFLFQ